jgi:hypothetical protein
VSLWVRWAVVAVAALAMFGIGWWVSQSVAGLDTGVAVGVASVPFILVLTLGGVWADRARRKDRGSTDPVVRSPASVPAVAEPVRIGYRLRGRANVQSERPRIRNQDIAFDVDEDAKLHDKDTDIE